MNGQYGDSSNGAGESAPNYHEGWGRVDVGSAVNSSHADGDTVVTAETREYIFNVPAGLSELRVVLAYTDPASSPGVGPHLVNDLDMELIHPDTTIQTLTNDLDPLRGMILSSPAAGIYEVHITGTNVPNGPQPFAVAVNVPGISNATNDLDFDGVDDDIDDCLGLFGTSTLDRQGCPDSDGDEYSDGDVDWTVADGADAFPSDPSQWADTDQDGYGDESAGTDPDACVLVSGTSITDRISIIRRL